MSFIKYIENLWVKISQSISQQWHRFLLMIEPLFIRFIHYLETVVWKASKEVLDFLYDRQNDLIASPYFDRFTNFTQDIDKLYRDIKSNDIITNIQKYTGRYNTFPKGKILHFCSVWQRTTGYRRRDYYRIKRIAKITVYTLRFGENATGVR